MIRSIHAVLLTVRRPSRSSQYQLISPLSISPNPGFKVADGFFMSRLPHRVALQSSVVLQMFPFGTKRSSIGRSKSESWGSAYRRSSDKLLKFKHYGGAKKDWRKEGTLRQLPAKQPISRRQPGRERFQRYFARSLARYLRPGSPCDDEKDGCPPRGAPHPRAAAAAAAAGRKILACIDARRSLLKVLAIPVFPIREFFGCLQFRTDFAFHLLEIANRPM